MHHSLRYICIVDEASWTVTLSEWLVDHQDKCPGCTEEDAEALRARKGQSENWNWFGVQSTLHHCTQALIT